MLPLGYYTHYKKPGLFHVLFVGKYEPTLEEVVVYKEIESNPLGQYWVRPLSAFTEQVVNEAGISVSRFTFFKENEK